MADSLKDLPEFFEHDLGESLRARTEALASFRELGPPDLCHIIKATSKPPIKEVGSYHYVSGVDASSSASLAAYINSLQYLTDEQQGWFSKNIGWRIRSGIYCCYNAFARVDVRVEVKIPGGVESHVVDMKGERHEARPDVWEEAYISGIIRSFAYSDDSAYRLAGYRKLDPVPNLKAEKRMLEAASQLFWKGWLFGTEPEYQISSAVSNHMVFGLMKYFTDSHRYEAAAEFFKPLCDKDPEIAAFLARAYFGADEETKAIQVLYDALSKNPMSYVLIHAQVDFLNEKNRPDLALELAKQAVKCSPSEFVAWAKLTEIYIGLGAYESALLTLNSCPMFTFNEKDMHRMPPPARTHFPIKAELQNVSGFDDDASMNEVQQSLLRLPAPTLRGTFAQAYVLLTQLVEKIGWDELLRRRSLVFVMEEEYRLQKAQEEERFSSSGERSSENHGKKHLDSLLGEVGNREHDEGKTKAAMVKIAKPETAQQTCEEKEGEGDEEVNAKSVGFLVGPFLAQPSVRSNEPSDVPEEENFSFSNKRLCERWLDNLFMVLYDDLRAYTIWRAEATHFKAQNVAYRKNPAEWEILGDLALRLHNKEEALEAYYLCLESRFSPRAHQRTLELNAEAGHIQPSLGSIVKLAVYQDRWYHDMVYPSPVAENLFRLIRRHGQSKVHNALISMSLPQAMQKLVNRYFTYAETFRIEGSQA